MQPATSHPYACDNCRAPVYPDALSNSTLELTPDGLTYRWHVCAQAPPRTPQKPYNAVPGRTSRHRGSWFGGATR